MADLTGLTAAQIAALIDSGAERTITRKQRIGREGMMIMFTVGDSSSPAPGAFFVTMANGEYTKSAKVTDIVGAGPENALTGAEANQLQALLNKMYAHQMLP